MSISAIKDGGTLTVGSTVLQPESGNQIRIGAYLVCEYDFRNPNSYPGSGATVTDLTGRGNNATITTGAGSSTFNTMGQRRLTIASGAYFSAVSDADFGMGTGDFTIEVWVRFNSWPGGGTAAAAGILDLRPTGAATARPFIITDVPPTISSKILTGHTGTIVVTQSDTVALSTWYHIIATRLGGTWWLYINGVSKGSAANSTNLLTTGTLTCGRNSANTARIVNGDYCIVRVYKGLGFTSNQVLQNYNADQNYFN
jgi:hypothetical protein